jgi:hypothetical protein
MNESADLTCAEPFHVKVEDENLQRVHVLFSVSWRDFIHYGECMLYFHCSRLTSFITVFEVVERQTSSESHASSPMGFQVRRTFS